MLYMPAPQFILHYNFISWLAVQQGSYTSIYTTFTKGDKGWGRLEIINE